MNAKAAARVSAWLARADGILGKHRGGKPFYRARTGRESACRTPLPLPIHGPTMLRYRTALAPRGRRLALIPLLVAALAGGMGACAPLGVAAGYASHILCSETFVSGLPPEQIYAESVAPQPSIRLVRWALRYQVDRPRREVRVTIAGAFESRSVYREGLGCLTVHGQLPAEAPPSLPENRPGAAVLPVIAGPSVVEPRNELLRRAVDRAFGEPERPPHRWTKAVVIVKDGRVVAERYAPGYGVETPLLGWSASKSVVNALIGVLVQQGRISLYASAPVAAWRASGNPRGAITIDELLRQTSGLDLAAATSAFDPSVRMLFLERDMAGFAERARLKTPPGVAWSYTDGNYQILSRILRDAAGGGAVDVLRFARRELFAPLGMHGVTLEFDATGTPVGAAFLLAPARDWARFGMLYLDDGVVGGHRILPAGWVSYASSRTLDSPYAAGFWLGRRDWRARWRLPEDCFFASGALGQRIVIVPSERLVIVRFGVTQMWPDFDPEGFGQLIADVRTALPSARQSPDP